MRRVARAILGAVLVWLSVGDVPPTVAATGYPVEARYSAAGPFPGVVNTVLRDGDRSYTAWFSSPSRNHPAPRPLIVWGNGNAATPDDYSGLLRHLASWGFIVVAPNNDAVGDGTAMRAALTYALVQNRLLSSPLYNMIDPSFIAAIGHSRGSVGAIHVAQSSAEITTTVLLNLPIPARVRPTEKFEPADIKRPTLLLGSENDEISTPQGLRAYFDAIPAPAALAVRAGAEHSSVQGDGGGFLGYVVAWLQYRLLDDLAGRSVFAGPAPELATNAGWQHQALRGLA
ncbi:MAG TPA: alpha/beta hydrolase [Mycobacteriales bacterium]|jgi:pimeloyl-ACP methyl ester carboxylesterase|nr:alpha/beta hydrolase [Mycobacteriales bacterium]